MAKQTLFLIHTVWYNLPKSIDVTIKIKLNSIVSASLDSFYYYPKNSAKDDHTVCLYWTYNGCWSKEMFKSRIGETLFEADDGPFELLEYPVIEKKFHHR